MRRLLVVLGAVLLTSWNVAAADRVVPTSNVINGVVIRAAASSGSDPLGVLRPGETLLYLASVPNWHQVQLANGQTGFVSKRWTEVRPDPVITANAIRFAVHFLDVGTGDSAIIDVGDREIIIDGGDSITVLNGYAQQRALVNGPIELVVVTHGDTDHWNGLRRLLGFDGVIDNPPAVLEYWDPGYSRDCNPASDGGRRNYLAFVDAMRSRVPPAAFKRPLQNFHPPATLSGAPQPMAIRSVPGVAVTVLSSEATPQGGECSYIINNASIVVKVEIDGIRFLFTGDANGKERDEGSPGTPGHIEQKLLALEQVHPGTLKADVLKVPHHGSETASTQAFIDAVNPQFVIVSASTKHHLPRSTTMQRYDNGQRVVLRTDQNHENNRDHIICARVIGELTCNYATVLDE